MYRTATRVASAVLLQYTHGPNNDSLIVQWKRRGYCTPCASRGDISSVIYHIQRDVAASEIQRGGDGQTRHARATDKAMQPETSHATYTQ